MNESQQLNLSMYYYYYLKKNNLLNNRLLTFSVRPLYEKTYSPYLLGYTCCFEKLKHNHKWIIVPYLSNFSQFPPSLVNFSKNRNITAFFSGSPIKKRKQIFQIINEKIKNSLTIEMSRSNLDDIQKQLYKLPFILSKSKYCIVPRSDSPSSKRFYDSVIYGCIPIIISDHFELPFDHTQIDWKQCTIRVPERNIETLPEVIKNITEKEYKRMYEYLQYAREFIRFDNGISPINGVGSILWELYFSLKKYEFSEWKINEKEIKNIEQYLKFN